MLKKHFLLSMLKTVVLLNIFVETVYGEWGGAESRGNGARPVE